MFRNYSKRKAEKIQHGGEVAVKGFNYWYLVILPAWVLVGYYCAQFVLLGIVSLIALLGISLNQANQAVLNTVFAALLYILTLVIVIGGPWLIKKMHTSNAELGLTRLPSWMDILLTPAGIIAYLILSAAFTLIATNIFPGFNANQLQETGFDKIHQSYELLLAFVTLVIIAPVAEEILFRGYLYGKLRKIVPIWAAALATSLLFGLVHGAWNLAIDTFALSIVLCGLRELTGAIWSPILLHMSKNAIAFYILFISPSILNTLVK